MPTVILELITGTVLIGSMINYVARKRQTKDPDFFGRFCICYTKEDRFNNFTYIPWITRTYKTEDDMLFEAKELAKLANNSSANSYLREQGFEGLSIIDLEDGREWYWSRLQNNSIDYK
jgi:hypothetical protein